MKCVCPMGGDRTCPDDCPLAVWTNLSAIDRKAQRKPIAEKLYKQGFTEMAIATQLGVSQSTIRDDLRNLVVTTKSNPPKTASNPKGAGRPKGSTTRRKNTTVSAERAALAILDGSKTYPEAEQESGLSNTVLRAAVAREEGRREPIITRDMLSMSAQQKLDAAIRQAKRKLEIEIETRCREDLQRWLNEVTLPQYAKELGILERSIRERKGVMDRITYRKILACLHPDRVSDPVLKKRYEEAFRLFTELEKRVLDEKESPTQFRKMPRTYEELMAMKAKVQAGRRAKRAGKSNVGVRR